MSQTYATKKKTAAPIAQGKASENVSKSDMLRMSGAGAPQPMSPELREKFEPGFGADFSNIRISRGHIPEEMGVQAVAKGTDILIDSRAGMDVLGHELAHVVQQAQGQVQGGYPVVHDAALEHQADVMGARAASGMSAMEGGISGFGGGETMSIAPMSDASAPAQCKSKEEKAAEKQAAKAQKNASAIQKTALPRSGSTEALTPKMIQWRDYQKERQRIAKREAIRSMSDATEMLAPVNDPINEAKNTYLQNLLAGGFDTSASMKDMKEYRRDALGKTYYNQDTIAATSQMFKMLEDFVSTPEYGDMAQEMYENHGTHAHTEIIRNDNKLGKDDELTSDMVESYMLKQLLSKGIGGIAKEAAGENPSEDTKNFIFRGIMTNLGNVEGLRGAMNDTENPLPEELKGLVASYEPLRAKMVAQMKGESLPTRGQAVEPKPGYQYITRTDLPQSGPGWERTTPQSKPANRGDLFREEYNSLNMADQVEMLRNYSYLSSMDNMEDRSEDDAYFDILSKLSPEMMDEILRQQEAAAGMLNAQNKTNAAYEGDADKAKFLTSNSSDADYFQSFSTLVKNIGMGGGNDKAYEYYKDKSAVRAKRDERYRNQMTQAQDIVTDSNNAWAEANPEIAETIKERERDRQVGDVKNWNASRKAKLTPAPAPEPARRKHHFRRWLNK